MNLLQKLFWILWFWQFSGAMAHAEPVSLDEYRAYPLAGHLEVFEDTQASVDFAQILTSPINQSFKIIPGFFNEGFGRQVVWFRFQVIKTRPFSSGTYLALGPPVLDYVTVYVQTSDDPKNPDSYKKYNLGDHISVSDSQRFQPEFVAPLNLPDGLPRWVYIRLQTSSNLALLASIKPGDILAKSGNKIIILQVAMLSVFLIVATIGLLFYSRIRQNLYGFFGLYLFFLFNNRIAATGILPLIFPSFAHRINDVMVNQNACGTWIFLVLFGFSLFKPVSSQLQRQLFRVLLAVACLMFVLSPFLPVAFISRANYLNGIVLFSLLAWLSFKSLRMGLMSHWFFCMAFVLLLFIPIMEFLRLTGILPISPFTINVVQLLTFGHIVLLTLGLAEKLRIDQSNALSAERNAKQNAEAMAVEMTFELRQKQQDLEQTLERQSRFVSMVSHEYRTPLTIIRTNLDLLSKKKHDPDGTLAFAVNKMKRAISRLVEVLEINLDKAKFTDDSFRLRLEKFALADSVEEVIHQAKEFWPERPLSLSQDDMAEIIVLGDQKLLKTVILNLLDNAVKYSPERTAVEVNLYRQGNECVLSVTDHGLGIAHEECERVFEKNYRIPGNNHVAGSGIGLYLVARIVQEHQGSVSIRSDNNGTTATIRLPIDQAG